MKEEKLRESYVKVFVELSARRPCGAKHRRPCGANLDLMMALSMCQICLSLRATGVRLFINAPVTLVYLCDGSTPVCIRVFATFFREHFGEHFREHISHRISQGPHAIYLRRGKAFSGRRQLRQRTRHRCWLPPIPSVSSSV